MDKDRIVGPFIQPHLDFFWPDKDSGWGINEFSKDDSSAAMFVTPEMLCEHLICRFPASVSRTSRSILMATEDDNAIV